MRNRTPAKSLTRSDSIRRLERAAGDFNVVLLMFAIGLAVLDATCFVAQRVVDHLPPVTQVVSADAQAGIAGSTDASPPK